MATRFYIPASGSAPLGSLTPDANWELSTILRLPSPRTKSNTALANDTWTWTAGTTQQCLWWQLQTEPLAEGFSFTTSHTVSMVVRVIEATLSADTHLAFSLRVVSNDGATVRGTLLLYHATSTEFPTSAATRIHSARAFTSNIMAQGGDRLIMEIGLHGVTPALDLITMRYGDPSATSDFALTAGLTTDLCPWWEVSPDLPFITVPHRVFERRRPTGYPMLDALLRR